MRARRGNGGSDTGGRLRVPARDGSAMAQSKGKSRGRRRPLLTTSPPPPGGGGSCRGNNWDELFDCISAGGPGQGGGECWDQTVAGQRRKRWEGGSRVTFCGSFWGTRPNQPIPTALSSGAEPKQLPGRGAPTPPVKAASAKERRAKGTVGRIRRAPPPSMRTAMIALRGGCAPPIERSCAHRSGTGRAVVW